MQLLADFAGATDNGSFSWGTTTGKTHSRICMLSWCMSHSSHFAVPGLHTILETHLHAEKTSSLSKRSSSGERGSVHLVPATQIFNTRHRASTGPSETTQLDQTLGSLGCPPDRCWPLISIEKPCSRAVTLSNMLPLRRHTMISKMRPGFRTRAC